MATKEEIKVCFESYDAADKAVLEAKALLEEKLKIRSECVKSILDVTGSKGPYAYKGDTVKIVVRGDTHFFRGKTNGDLITVD